jgi:hypothetical protein
MAIDTVFNEDDQLESSGQDPLSLSLQQEVTRGEEQIDMRTLRTLSLPRLALMLAICVSALCLIANAQYFGRNKVEYGKFDFRVMKTEHFDIYYYPQEETAVKYAARMAERWYTRHSKVFADTLNGRQPLILYASHPDF